MRVLIACEFSGTVREAFRDRGHFAYSCDLLSTEIPGPHFKMDVLKILDGGWDLLIGHPPCTYLSTVGNKWFKTQPERHGKREAAFQFFMALYNAPIPRVALENPQGYLNTAFRKPNQTIHPWYFGDPFHKRTCLWLRGLPKLQYYIEDTLFAASTATSEPTFEHYDKNGRGKRWCEMLVRLPQAERWKARSKTFQGIANAMAEQWGAT
jgi:site-specific DNA-cytosine methylase